MKSEKIINNFISIINNFYILIYLKSNFKIFLKVILK